MIHAPAREANCILESVQVDVTQTSFNQTWEVSGYIGLHDRKAQDPMDAQNRALVRPRACAMGGTSIAVTINAMATNQFGRQGSSIMYMVLRPKAAAPPQPTAF